MLAEAMLLKAGATQGLGEITRGTTASDFDDQEKEHQHSLQTTVLSLTYDGRQCWTPGLAGDGCVRALLNSHQAGDKGFGPALGPGAGEALFDNFLVTTAVPEPSSTLALLVGGILLTIISRRKRPSPVHHDC